MVRGIIIGHGDFARTLLTTAEQIVGKQTGVTVITNIGLSGEHLREKIEQALDQRDKQETIIFVDLPGGSCTISCYHLLKKTKSLNIICGVNLPIILEFFMLRNKHTAKELVPILLKKGRENIFQLKDKT
jgi:mannose/fructose/sorbose-specific phosphotransferase system IIA component